MKVFVKTLSGKSVTVVAEPEDSVERFKARIFDVERLSIDLQRLTFAGEELENYAILSDCGIGDQSTVHLNVRLCGGSLGSFNGKLLTPTQIKLAEKYNVDKKICTKCYARLPPNATNCRKKKCGHTTELRDKHKLGEYISRRKA